MKAIKHPALTTFLLMTLSACWEGDPKLDVSEPHSLYFVSATIPEFEQCNLQDRVALERAKPAVILPSADCADGQCVVSGRGYSSKDHVFNIAFVGETGECRLRELDGLQFTESFSVEVSMNHDYLKSLGLGRSEIENIAHRNLAGSRHGDLRSSLIDSITHDVKVTIFYDKLPKEDDFVISGQTVSFVLPTNPALSGN